MTHSPPFPLHPPRWRSTTRPRECLRHHVPPTSRRGGHRPSVGCCGGARQRRPPLRRGLSGAERGREADCGDSDRAATSVCQASRPPKSAARKRGSIARKPEPCAPMCSGEVPAELRPGHGRSSSLASHGEPPPWHHTYPHTTGPPGIMMASFLDKPGLAARTKFLPLASPASSAIVQKSPKSCSAIASEAKLWPKIGQFWPSWALCRPTLAQTCPTSTNTGRCWSKIDQARLYFDDFGEHVAKFGQKLTNNNPNWPAIGHSS